MDRRSPGEVESVFAVAITVAAIGATAARVAAGSSIVVDGVQGSVQPALQATLALVWLVPAIVLVQRRPALPFGRLGTWAAMSHAAAALLVAVAPDDRWCIWAAMWLIVVEVPLLGAVVQLFPTGRPISGWRRYLEVSMVAGAMGVVAAAVEVLPTATEQPWQSVAGVAAVPLLAFAGLGGVIPLAVRFGRVVQPERRAVALLLAVVVAGLVVPGLIASGGGSAEVAAQVFTAGEIAVVTVVVLRQRVWGLAPMTGRSLQRVVIATDAERRRVRSELHDGVGAGLTAIRLKVDAAQALVRDRPERASSMLASASGDIGSLLDDVRRLVDGLRPVVLDRTTLAEALQLRADELSANTPGLTIDLRGHDHAARLGPGSDAAVYHLVIEALHNVVRHAGAGTCVVAFSDADGAVAVAISDDGGGHDVDDELVADPDRGGLGMSSMAARAAEVGGYVVAGPRPGGGFEVRAVIPEPLPEVAS